MIYSESHLWFEDVLWVEHGTPIQCLVDTSETTPEAGFYVIADEERLSIYAAQELNEHPHNASQIIGKAIRWSVYEKNFSGEKRA